MNGDCDASSIGLSPEMHMTALLSDLLKTRTLKGTD